MANIKKRKRSELNRIIFAALCLLGVSSGSILNLIYPSISPFLAPYPANLFLELIADPLYWIKAIAWTTFMSLLAVFISTILGSLIGFFAAFVRLDSIDRWSQLVWSIPIVAISTYLLLVVGNGWLYGLSLAVFLGFYPVEKHVFCYCTARSEGLSSISASFCLSNYQEFRHLRFPGALRSLGATLSQIIPLCFIGETMGEFSLGKISEFTVGLGGILLFSKNYSNYTQMWVSIIFMMLLVFIFGWLADFFWEKIFPKNDEGDAVQ